MQFLLEANFKYSLCFNFALNIRKLLDIRIG